MRKTGTPSCLQPTTIKMILLLLWFAILMVGIILLVEYSNNVRRWKKKKVLIPAVSAFEDEKHKKDDVSKVPRTVFMFWHEDGSEKESPIQMFLDTAKKQLAKAGWQVYLLHEGNLSHHVDPALIAFWKRHSEHWPRFSDFLRVHLLAEQGGVWMDASTVILDPFFLERFREELYESKKELLLFEYHELSTTPGGIYLENWFLMATLQSRTIVQLRDRMHQAAEMGYVHYIQEHLRPSISLSGIAVDLRSSPPLTYHLQHALLRYLYYHERECQTEMHIKHAEESMFRLQISVGWNPFRFLDAFLSLLETMTPPPTQYVFYGNHHHKEKEDREPPSSTYYYAIKWTGGLRNALFADPSRLRRWAHTMKQLSMH